jgi:transcriptional regulator with XRE-family HTH domain
VLLVYLVRHFSPPILFAPYSDKFICFYNLEIHYMDIRHVTGENIKRIREEKGIKQATLAHEIGLAIPTLSNLENGKTNPGLLQLADIARALKVPVAELVREGSQQLSKTDKLKLADTILKAFDSVHMATADHETNMEIYVQQQNILHEMREIKEMLTKDLKA